MARRVKANVAATPDPGRVALAEELYRSAALIRAAELRILEFVNDGKFGGLWHPGLGQEGLQAGAMATLRYDDYLFYTHRGPGAPMAKGMPMEVLFADLLGRSTGELKAALGAAYEREVIHRDDLVLL